MEFRVLISQKIAEEGIRLLEESGATIVVPPSYDEETLVNYAKDVDAVLARTEIYSRRVIENAKHLKIIARHGIGVDNIDVKAAVEHGVVVTNAPSANINAVAELVLTLMLAGTRHLVTIDQATRDGDFGIRNQLFGYELKGKTLGIIGFGNIGRLIAEKCKLGLGMNIAVYDPHVTAGSVDSYVEILDTLDDLLSRSDVVTLHVPYVPATHHLINKKSFRAMKSDAILINAARGGVVDEEALVEALNDRRIRGACVDVFQVEPPEAEHPLFKLDNVIVTPHLGAQTHEAFKQMAIDAASEIIAVKAGKAPVHPIHKVTT
ncbi:hydroxyacid dehydrogenase [Oceanobacillus kapialis]|uniref:Hydroxyacid dehydrogenase n=1 Tax=Oceanobacillus kapialis TaxID=481353 RepID=A0ABW5Q1F6_9BACI